MLNKVKESLTVVGWYAIGFTAIIGEKAIKNGKIIASEIKDGTPQDLVRYGWDTLRSKFKSSSVTTEDVISVSFDKSFKDFEDFYDPTCENCQMGLEHKH